MKKAIRGPILHFIEDPHQVANPRDSYQYFDDGILVIEQGKVVALNSAQTLLPRLEPTITIEHYPEQLIMPGFIDCHIHYPQTEMIASYGEQLLQWLNNYTFVEEQKFASLEHSKEIAEFFIEQLLSAGTTTALVFATVHPESVEGFFTVAEQLKLRMIAGKVLMDCNCPDALKDNAELGYQQSKMLIEKWHQKGRLSYAVTPRFAPTSTAEQLAMAGKLLTEYPELYLHTHLSENLDEIAWVKQLFPEQQGYLDVYHHHGLVNKRSVFAHGIHLTDDEWQVLAANQAAVAFCPTSNLFLGSGLFDLQKAEQHQCCVGMGTDIGAGTSFSMLHTLNEAYKTQQLRGNKLDPLQAFYLATLGGAKALHLSDKIGSFRPDNEADFIVIDFKATPLMQRRIKHCQTLEEKLFVLSMLGDDRHIKHTYIMGERVSFN